MVSEYIQKANEFYNQIDTYLRNAIRKDLWQQAKSCQYIAKNAHFTPKKKVIDLKTGLIFNSFPELSATYCGPTLGPTTSDLASDLRRRD